jgi:hypothetical protein
MADVNPDPETQDEAPPEEGQPEEKPEGEEGEGEGTQEQPEEGEGGEGQPEGDEGEKAEEAKAEGGEAEQEPRKRAGGWQRKIERLEKMNEQLLAQLTSQRGGPPPPSGQPQKEKSPEEKAAEYIDSLVEKRLAAREEQQKAQTRVADFQRRTAEVRAKNPDFDDVVMSVDVPVSPALEQALLTSEAGPAIMYQLAKSPAELARICALPPLDAAREIGRLEAKLASGTAAPVKPKPAIRPPAPPTSVSGSTPSARSLEELSISDYKRAYRSGRR